MHTSKTAGTVLHTATCEVIEILPEDQAMPEHAEPGLKPEPHTLKVPAQRLSLRSQQAVASDEKGGQLQAWTREAAWMGTQTPGRRVREGRVQRVLSQVASQQVVISNPPCGQPGWRQTEGIWDLFRLSTKVKDRSWSPGYLWVTQLHYIKNKFQILNQSLHTPYLFVPRGKRSLPLVRGLRVGTLHNC